MKFKSPYTIEYGYFYNARFEGKLGQVEPSVVEMEIRESFQENGSTQVLKRRVEYSDKLLVEGALQSIEPNEVISYEFSIENGVLVEIFDVRSSIDKPTFKLTTFLTPLKQKLFLNNIFTYFGVYLAVFIKDHKYHLTGQTYILEELDKYLEEHSVFNATCGDYTILLNKNSEKSKEYLGIEAEFERNTLQPLDKRKGITLFLYRDDENKTREFQDNFVVNVNSISAFVHISQEKAQMCGDVLNALSLEGKEYDVIYSFVDDYLAYEFSL